MNHEPMALVAGSTELSPVQWPTADAASAGRPALPAAKAVLETVLHDIFSDSTLPEWLHEHVVPEPTPLHAELVGFHHNGDVAVNAVDESSGSQLPQVAAQMEDTLTYMAPPPDASVLPREEVDECSAAPSTRCEAAPQVGETGSSVPVQSSGGNAPRVDAHAGATEAADLEQVDAVLVPTDPLPGDGQCPGAGMEANTPKGSDGLSKVDRQWLHRSMQMPQVASLTEYVLERMLFGLVQEAAEGSAE